MIAPSTPTLGPARLQPISGEALAGYFATGLRAPDLNMTAQAGIDIASSVQVAGDAIRITVGPGRYLGEFAANDADITNDERDEIPTFTAVVDALGRVSALVVDTDPSQPDQSEADHRNRYIVAAHFDDLDQIAAPRAEDRDPRRCQLPHPRRLL